MSNQMRPIHPGEILREELETIQLSANAFSKKLYVSANRITTILNGQRSITADTAIRLAKFFKTTPEFWLNLQRDYDLKIALSRHGKEINHQIVPYEDAA